ncbi:MAG: RsmD family RNA methyltransferase [Chloroflexus sp.]
MSDRDPRNRLNDLDARAWTYALRSVISTAYPTRGPASLAYHLRRKHPTPKPPQLMAELIRFFTRRDGHILDLFAGAGSTLIASTLEGRTAIGIDLSPEYAALYHAVCAELQIAPQPYLVADARQLLDLPILHERPFDLILTDPPYAAMMARPKTGERKKRGQANPTPFTSSPADLGNLPYHEFITELSKIIANSLQLLRPGGYVVLFAKDLQPTPEHHNMLHADLVITLRQIAGLEYRGYQIWHDQSQNLYPFGYPYAFVANQMHQFILIFRWHGQNSLPSSS